MKKQQWHLVWLVFLLAGCSPQVDEPQPAADWPHVVESADGTPISFEVVGSGEPALVFVHGWSCDGRYWREQVADFAPGHQVITLDLAGHGHSGLSRQDYTMAAFGEDVRAVVEAAGVEQAILIGHSMGGPVSLHAATKMPERVIGVVGVDTFQQLSMDIDEEQLEAFLAPMEADFRAAAAAFVDDMFLEETDARLREWVIDDMTAAPPAVAVDAMRSLISDYITGDFSRVLEAVEAPVVAINADFWPTDTEALRELSPGFEAIIVEGKDHFLHMAAPATFNAELEQVITDMARADD